MPTQRVHLIDGLRGFSLLGILLANLLIFQYGLFAKDQYDYTTLDEWAYRFTKIFIEGSFLPIFTFLFGYSMIKMADSIQRKDWKVKRYFFRRSLMLIGLGILHSVFIWEGDILLFYGIMSMLLLIFVKRQTKTLFIWMIILFAISIALSFFSIGEGPSLEEIFTLPEEVIQRAEEVYGTGTYWEIVQYRMSEESAEGIPSEIALVALFLSPLIMIPLFLFGMYAARKNWFTQPTESIRTYRLFAVLLVPIGLAMKAFSVFAPTHFLAGVCATNGPTILTIGYIFTFSYIYAKISQTFVMQAFESVGKLSLTNYILQSVICTTIFYGYGLGLFAKLGVFNGILLGLFIYAVQCMVSYIYLKKFKRGPLEWVLRVWTNWSWTGRVKERKN